MVVEPVELFSAFRQKEGMRGRWELSDAQCQLIEPILRPNDAPMAGVVPWQDTRPVLNGILWVLGTGAQWRELPKRYPPYQTCHRRFQQWVREGKLERILRVLAEELQARGKLQPEEVFIDASFTGAKKGPSRSGPPNAAKLAVMRDVIAAHSFCGPRIRPGFLIQSRMPNVHSSLCGCGHEVAVLIFQPQSGYGGNGRLPRGRWVDTKAHNDCAFLAQWWRMPS
jgi:transposase